MSWWSPSLKPAEYDPVVNHPACIIAEKFRFNQECPVCEATSDKATLLILDCEHIICQSCFVEWASRPNEDKLQVPCPICRQKTMVGKTVFVIVTLSGKNFRIVLNNLSSCVADFMGLLTEVYAPQVRLIKSSKVVVDFDFDPTFDPNPAVLSWIDFERDEKISLSRQITLHGVLNLGAGQNMFLNVVTPTYPVIHLEIRKHRPVTYLYHLFRQKLEELGENKPLAWCLICGDASFIDCDSELEVRHALGPYTTQPRTLIGLRFE